MWCFLVKIKSSYYFDSFSIFQMCFDEFDHKMINDLILLDLSLHLFLFHRLACRMKKYMPISEAWESIYLPMPFLGSLSFDGLLVVSLLALLNIRVGSKNFFVKSKTHLESSHSNFYVKSIWWYQGKFHTVWKFANFTATHILCEINFGKFRVSKMASLTTLEAMISSFWDIFVIFMGWNFVICNFCASEIANMAIIEIFNMLKLISRKIWVAVKFENFHTVWNLPWCYQIDFT